MRLLVIEDDNTLRESLAAQLAEAGYAVEQAADGREGLYFAMEYPVDLAIIDLGLPEVSGLDIMIVRELTGGIYFGEKARTDDSATDVCTYTRSEIERVLRIAGTLAMGRDRKVTSVDKSNVLETSRLWRDVTDRVLADEFPAIETETLLVDAAAMHLLSRPADFDVMLTENLFGDILTWICARLYRREGLLG